MRRLWIAIAVAIAAALPGTLQRFTGWHGSALLIAALAGLAILAAGFMLSWGVEAAEEHVSRGLALALLALVTVLPEFVVDFYYALRGGSDQASHYAQLAAANMTGANRLLVGLGWPLIVLLYRWRGGAAKVELSQGNAIEICYLALGSLYSFVLVAKSRIDAMDALVLFALYGAYLWRLSRERPAATSGDDDDDDVAREPGLAAALNTLPKRRRFALAGALALVAGAIILFEAEPFAESLVTAAQLLGVNHFFLIQWVSPLAGELPEMVIMILFTLSLRPGHALGALVSDKINQWTLLLGALPLVFAWGAGHVTPLWLAPRQHEELFLTAAQSVFAVALLLRLRLTLGGALVLLVLFLTQVGIALITQHDEPRTIAWLTAFAWLYILMAAVLAVVNRQALVRYLRIGLFPPRRDERNGHA